MDSELLSLKWNNHRNTFLGVIKILRNKASYSDVTLACEGKFYQAHKLVLSGCSDYFGEIFENTPCKNPVIVLKDISPMNLEFLLDYMYLGEVNVKQCYLSALIKAAECLHIKGLAVPDDEDPPKLCKTKRTLLDDSDEQPVKRRKKRHFENSQTSADKEDSQPTSPVFVDSLNVDVKAEPLDKDLIEKCDDVISINKHEVDETNSIQYEATSSDVVNEIGETWQDYNFDDENVDTNPSLIDETALLRPDVYRNPHTTTKSTEPPHNFDGLSTTRTPINSLFYCHICDYKTRHSFNLKKHIRIHTGEKPFACSMCTHRTSDASGMKSHTRSHFRAHNS